MNLDKSASFSFDAAPRRSTSSLGNSPAGVVSFDREGIRHIANDRPGWLVLGFHQR